MARRRTSKTGPVDGWWWRGIGTAALLAVTAVPICAAGWALAHVSDFIARLP
jgi:hypothetical protein